MKARKDFVCPTWKESWKWKWKETYISGSAHTFFRRSIWYYLAVRQIRKTECPIGKNWALIWQKLSVYLAEAERWFGRNWALTCQKLFVILAKAVRLFKVRIILRENFYRCHPVCHFIVNALGKPNAEKWKLLGFVCATSDEDKFTDEMFCFHVVCVVLFLLFGV